MSNIYEIYDDSIIDYPLSSTTEYLDIYAGNADSAGNITGNVDKSPLSYELRDNNIPITSVIFEKMDDTAYSITVNSTWSNLEESSAKLYLKNSEGITTNYIYFTKPEIYRISITNNTNCDTIVLGVGFSDPLKPEHQQRVTEIFTNTPSQLLESCILKTIPPNIKYIDYQFLLYWWTGKPILSLEIITTDGPFSIPNGNDTLYILGRKNGTWKSYGTIIDYAQGSKNVSI